MEVFLSDDFKDPKTRFLEILCSYLKISERNLGKIVKVSKSSKDILKIQDTPLLVDSKTNTKIEGDEIKIAKFITDASGLTPLFFGNDDTENLKINNFVSHITNDLKYDGESLIKELNPSLLLCTFINGNITMSICDLLSYSLVAPIINQYSNDQKNEFCNVVRWADHIQNLKGVKEVTKDLKIWFSIPYEPFILEGNDKGKKKDKKDKKAQKPQGKEDKKEEKKEDNKEDKKEEKKEDKKEKKEKEKPKNEPQKDLHPMSKVDIRVGKVVNIFPNPEGDKLYNEEIDVGNGEVRKIASGLRGRVDINDLKDSLVVVICNLKPRDLKGWTSHGMILCSSKDDKVEPLRPPKECQPGDLVYIGDLPREPASDKKCPWSKVCEDLKVNAEGKATYKGELIWKTDKGEIIAPTLAEGKIS